MKYVIWGCGKQGKSLFYAFGSECVEAFIDSNTDLQGRTYENTPIISYDTYLRHYSDKIVIISPARDTESIIQKLRNDKIDFLENYSIHAEIITAVNNKAFCYLEKLVKDYREIYLYGFTSYNVLLYEYFTRKGKTVGIILDGKTDEKIPDAFKRVVLSYEKNKYKAICVTRFEDCDKLQKENIVPFYSLGDYPTVICPQESLAVPTTPFLNTSKREKKIIVSLTTHEKRLTTVSYALGTIMRQTMQPDKIVVYMAEKCKYKLPEKLKEQITAGIEVRYVEDLKPHTKYFYALQEYPEDIVITVDDDIFYRFDLIERLYMSYLKFPECVSAMLAEKILLDDDGQIKKYYDWKRYNYLEDNEIRTPSMSLCAFGAGGVLYPPNCMIKEVFNKENIVKLCPKADDLWLKVMQILSNTSVVLATDEMHKPIEIENAQTFGLKHTNVICYENELQMRNLLKEYNEWLEGEKTVLEKIKMDSD